MEIVLRAVVVFLFLWLVTRVIGRKELAEMGTFELVLLIVIGDLVQQGVTQEDMSVTGAVLAVSTIALLVVGFSWVSFRWKRAAEIIEGRAVLIVLRGQLLAEAMRTERLTENELLSAARQQGIGELAEIEYGVLEADGNFSFVRADRGEPPHRPDREP